MGKLFKIEHKPHVGETNAFKESYGRTNRRVERNVGFLEKNQDQIASTGSKLNLGRRLLAVKSHHCAMCGILH